MMEFQNNIMRIFFIILFLPALISSFSCSSDPSTISDGDSDQEPFDEQDTDLEEVQEESDGEVDVNGEEENDELDREIDLEGEEEIDETDIDWNDIEVPPVFPWHDLSLVDYDPFNPDFPCEADEHYPGNSTREGALELYPGDCLTNMTLCTFNQEDWFHTELVPGNILVSFGKVNLPTPANKALATTYEMGVHIYWDGFEENSVYLSRSLPTISYNSSYSFCIQQGPIIEAQGKLPTQYKVPANHFTFALPKPTTLGDPFLPSCFKEEDIPPGYEPTSPYVATIQLEYHDKNMPHKITLEPYQNGSMEWLSSCQPDATRLGCKMGITGRLGVTFSAEDTKPECLLIGISTFPDTQPHYYMLFEEGIDQ